MMPSHTRRLLLGGTVLLVAGWLGLMALVAPALLGAVAAATLLPLSLVLLPYLAVGLMTRVIDAPGRPFRSTGDAGAAAESGGPGEATEFGPAEAD
jgi:hypothetical protein